MSEYTTYADPVMAAIEPSWLVPGFLEFGQVVLLTGPGGCGKSFLTANWAAAATRGELPGLDGEPGNVGFINMEDDPNTSTAWRLRAENAELGRIIDLTESAAGEPAELPRDAGMLRSAIDENKHQAAHHRPAVGGQFQEPDDRAPGAEDHHAAAARGPRDRMLHRRRPPRNQGRDCRGLEGAGGLGSQDAHARP